MKGAAVFSFMRKIVCPHCLTEIRSVRTPGNCPTCKHALPPQYIHDYEQHQPFFTQVFGWSRVGKTVFLQALTLMLVQMSNVWPRYTSTAVTDLSQEKVKEIREFLSKGHMPPPTSVGDKNVYIMLLSNMERWGSRALVTRDCAGEIFDTMNVPIEDAPYLLNAPTTFMLIGPDGDPSNEGGKTIDMLLNNYINTLMSKGMNFAKARRKLVVVFTKADSIANLPANLSHYLEADPLWAAVNARGSVQQMDAAAMQAYVDTMARVSDAIGDWVELDTTGKNFIRKAKEKNIDLRFTIISSTGDAVAPDGTMVSRLAPKRVLDPYFWALELQSAM